MIERECYEEIHYKLVDNLNIDVHCKICKHTIPAKTPFHSMFWGVNWWMICTDCAPSRKQALEAHELIRSLREL